MNDYTLLIVGNGFDLHLKYNTRYTDFFKHLLANQPIENKLLYFFYHAYDYGYMASDDWTSFEQMLCQYLEFWNYIFTSDNVVFSYEESQSSFQTMYTARLTIQNYKIIPMNCLRVLDISNPLERCVAFYWFDGGKKYKVGTRISSYPNLNDKLEIAVFKNFAVPPSLDDVKKYVIDSINDLLNDAEKVLSIYIKKETLVKKEKTVFIKNHIGDKVKKIVSFNYCHTAKEMFLLDEESVAYVHGDIDNEIVLGIEENMIEQQKINESTLLFTPFFKRSRRFIKRCNENFYHKIIRYLNLGSNIAIFGHSLDKSDKSLFRNIFDCEFNHCDIYYFGDEIDYRSKLIDLITIDKVEKLSNRGKLNFIKIE